MTKKPTLRTKSMEGDKTKISSSKSKKSKCEKSKSHISALPTGKTTKSIRDRIVYFAAFCGFPLRQMYGMVMPNETKTTESKMWRDQWDLFACHLCFDMLHSAMLNIGHRILAPGLDSIRFDLISFSSRANFLNQLSIEYLELYLGIPVEPSYVSAYEWVRMEMLIRNYGYA